MLKIMNILSFNRKKKKKKKKKTIKNFYLFIEFSYAKLRYFSDFHTNGKSLLYNSNNNIV